MRAQYHCYLSGIRVVGFLPRASGANRMGKSAACEYPNIARVYLNIFSIGLEYKVQAYYVNPFAGVVAGL